MVPANGKRIEECVTRAMRRMTSFEEWVAGKRNGVSGKNANPSWPALPGAYRVGDAGASVAVCVLTGGELVAPLAARPGIAIAGRAYSANLGLERVILNIAANPSIRFLLVCGAESPVVPGEGMIGGAAGGLACATLGPRSSPQPRNRARRIVGGRQDRKTGCDHA